MEQMMRTLRPSILNAIFPIFMSKLLRAFTIVFILGVIGFGFNYAVARTSETLYPMSFLVTLLIVLWLVLSLVPMARSLIELIFVKYIFYESHLVHEYKFLTIHRSTVPYQKIVNIGTKLNLWNRLFNAGDVTLFTAEDKGPDVVLRYVKNPLAIEKDIHQWIHAHTAHGSSGHASHHGPVPAHHKKV